MRFFRAPIGRLLQRQALPFTNAGVVIVGDCDNGVLGRPYCGFASRPPLTMSAFRCMQVLSSTYPWALLPRAARELHA